jgi:hydroxyacylglutathione hydrolase
MATVRNIAQGIRSFTSNAFLVDGERTVLVDAGNDFDAVGKIESATGTLDALVLTHTHSDHIGNVSAIVEAFDVDVWGFDPDHELVDHGIADGETIEMGDHDYEALHTPGHKNDHICLYAPTAGRLFAGDLVFENGGFGRTDLPEGDRPTLIESIEYLLSSVDESLSTMYVGHGPTVDTNPKQHIELALKAARF